MIELARGALGVTSLALVACSQGSQADQAAEAGVTAAQAAPTPTATATKPFTPVPDADPAVKNADEARADAAPLREAIPARFQGKYAESPDQCDNPSHGLFTIGPKAIDFFETNGEVRNVRVDGDYAAATVFEQYGDGRGTTYAFYMRLLPDGKLRYRYDDNERLTWVRCP